MLNLEQARAIGKRVASTQYTQVEADAFMLGYFFALQELSKSKGLSELEKNYKEACKVVNAAQHGVQADCLPCGHPKEAALQMEFGSWSCQMCKAANSR